MEKFLVTVLAFWNDITDTEKERGATATEYALLIGLIALAIVAAVTLVGTNLNNVFGWINTKLAAIPH